MVPGDAPDFERDAAACTLPNRQPLEAITEGEGHQNE
jgi:hypothetical protein